MTLRAFSIHTDRPALTVRAELYPQVTHRIITAAQLADGQIGGPQFCSALTAAHLADQGQPLLQFQLRHLAGDVDAVLIRVRRRLAAEIQLHRAQAAATITQAECQLQAIGIGQPDTAAGRARAHPQAKRQGRLRSLGQGRRQIGTHAAHIGIEQQLGRGISAEGDIGLPYRAAVQPGQQPRRHVGACQLVGLAVVHRQRGVQAQRAFIRGRQGRAERLAIEFRTEPFGAQLRTIETQIALDVLEGPLQPVIVQGHTPQADPAAGLGCLDIAQRHVHMHIHLGRAVDAGVLEQFGQRLGQGRCRQITVVLPGVLVRLCVNFQHARGQIGNARHHPVEINSGRAALVRGHCQLAPAKLHAGGELVHLGPLRRELELRVGDFQIQRKQARARFAIRFEAADFAVQPQSAVRDPGRQQRILQPAAQTVAPVQRHQRLEPVDVGGLQAGVGVEIHGFTLRQSQAYFAAQFGAHAACAQLLGLHIPAAVIAPPAQLARQFIQRDRYGEALGEIQQHGRRLQAQATFGFAARQLAGKPGDTGLGGFQQQLIQARAVGNP